MEKLKIKSKNGYLQMKDLPHDCIFNKVRTGCGATTIALSNKNKENYVIAVPTTELVINKCYPRNEGQKNWDASKKKAGLSPVENPTGYPLTTLNLIFTGKGSSLKRSDFLLLCEGKIEKGKRKMIPEPCFLEIGNKFIDTCKKVGFNDKDIAKRFLITEFNKIAVRKGSEEALKIFGSISPNEKEAMLNDRKSLNEDQVIEVFKEKTKDLWKESETSNENND